jgi:hypothetical protein
MPAQPKATEKRQAGSAQAPCACGVPHSSFPIPEGKASAPLRRTSRVPQKRLVFLRFVWLGEWNGRMGGFSPTSGNGEEREGGGHPMRLGERASINDDDDDYCAVRSLELLWEYCGEGVSVCLPLGLPRSLPSSPCFYYSVVLLLLTSVPWSMASRRRDMLPPSPVGGY